MLRKWARQGKIPGAFQQTARGDWWLDLDYHNQVTEQLITRLTELSVPKSKGQHLYLNDILREWRVDVLGYKVDSNGRINLGKCLVLAQRGHRRGKPIAEPTRRDYGNDCLQLEAEEHTRFPLSAPDIIDRTREILSPWLDKPTHYNGLRNTLARVYAYAIQRGLLRKKGLTDEALAAGKATDKGLHNSEAMKNFYVVEPPPKRVVNTLSGIR